MILANSKSSLPVLTYAKVLLLCSNGGKVKVFTPQNSFLEDLRL